MAKSLKSAALPLCVLAFLWFTLINHLRLEWTVNPQYGYAWSVPFLAAYLLLRRIRERPPLPSPLSFPPFFIHHSAFFLSFCAFLYAPTRLIQEANPEWRLISWLLALEVIGITLALLPSILVLLSGQSGRSAMPGKQRFLFPLLFFLVAVPWPTPIEAPVVQGLMRANVRTTIELLSLFGVPAVQHGNVIQIGAGMVGIDDACSGIRSFQASLMIALFLGEFYALNWIRRLFSVLAGFALAFFFNVGRTFLLTRLAAANGISVMAAWHDPAGITVLLACFISLWILIFAIRGSPPPSPSPTLNPNLNLNPNPLRSPGPRTILALAVWLLLVECGTELWYRSHEWRLPQNAAWTVQLPRDNPTFHDSPFSDKTRQFLRYDKGLSGIWMDPQGHRCQAIFFRWNPGRIAVQLAKSHTPEVCLSAAGRTMLSQSDLRLVPARGLELPFRSYVFRGEEGEAPLHVYYCLWEDRAAVQSFGTLTLTYPTRLAPVLAGRRNSGQRSLEFAVWGFDDDSQADAAFTSQLDHLIKVDR